MKIEGRNAVREAITAGVTIEKVIASSGTKDATFNNLINLIKQNKIKLQFVNEKALNAESITKHHQGVIAFATEFKYASVEDIIEFANKKNQPPFIVILDGVEDPFNFGSIVRVCECAGVHGIIIAKNRACSVNETVIKTSAGATAFVKIAKVTNVNTEIEKLKKQNIWVYALETGGENIYSANLKGAIALVIGSEGNGVSALTKKICDGVITIPQSGKLNSLNASVAAGVGVFEIVRQRGL